MNHPVTGSQDESQDNNQDNNELTQERGAEEMVQALAQKRQQSSNRSSNRSSNHSEQVGLPGSTLHQTSQLTSQKWFQGREPYCVIRSLGRGGFGITYLVQNPKGQYFVIKTLHGQSQDPDQAKVLWNDFYNEAIRMAKCDDHGHIVEIIEVIREEANHPPCLVMEYIEGQGLDTLGKLSIATTLNHIIQVGQALEYIHQKGLLHRDVKPQNIMVRSHPKQSNQIPNQKPNQAVLLDFGIARSFSPGETDSMTAFYTPGYSAVEQCFGQKQGTYTDVYSLAATLYFCLTGQVPEAAPKRYAQTNQNQPDPLIHPQTLNREIPEYLNQAILQGLAIQAEKRPQTVEQFLNLIRISVATTERQTDKIRDLPKGPRTWSKFGMLQLSAIGLLILGVGAISWQLIPQNNQPNDLAHPDPSEIIEPGNSLYQNPDYGFSLQYPQNWTKQENQPNFSNPQLLTLRPPAPANTTFPAQMAVEVQERDGNWSLEQTHTISKERIMSIAGVDALISEQEITIDNIPAYYWLYRNHTENADIQRMEVGVIEAGYEFIITYEAEVANYEQLETEVIKIIDSFKFNPTNNAERD
jgi:serine/threonine-protein kinase